jgi:hypothetical protein
LHFGACLANAASNTSSGPSYDNAFNLGIGNCSNRVVKFAAAIGKISNSIGNFACRTDAKARQDAHFAPSSKHKSKDGDTAVIPA